MADDNRFREPGSPYKHDKEVVAFAVIAPGATIDWSDVDHVPDSTLWIPESLWKPLASRTRLGRLKSYLQSRLGGPECRALREELSRLEAAAEEADVRLAAGLVRQKADTVAESGESAVLLVEGD